MPSLCRERKPEEKATQKYSPFNSQPSWNHIQPAGQLASHADVLRLVTRLVMGGTRDKPKNGLRRRLPDNQSTRHICPCLFFSRRTTNPSVRLLQDEQHFSHGLALTLCRTHPEQKAAREEEIPKVNGKHRKLKLDI